MGDNRRNPNRETVRKGIVKWVCVVLAPFILLLIVLNSITYWISSERVQESLSNMLQMQAYGVSGQLEEMENSVRHFCSDNMYHILVLETRSDEMDVYLSKQELYLQMKRYTLASSAEEAVFLYAPAPGQFLMSYPEISWEKYLQVREFLQERLADEELSYSSAWHVEEIEGSYYTLYLQKVYGVWVGSCAKISSIMDAMLSSQAELLRETKLFLEMDGGRYLVRTDGTILKSEEEKDLEATIEADGPRKEFRLILQPRHSFLAFSGQIYIWVLLVVSAILLGFLPFFLGQISRKITAPIKELGDAMVRLQKGNFETQLQTECHFREIEEIENTFNEMTRRIGALKNDIYEEKLLRQKTESDFLQIQIKPHFYLNSLNQIHILAEMGNVEAISQLSRHLVCYFRYLLRGDQKLVPLKDELTQIEDFLAIQKLHYPAGFVYECRAEPELEKLPVPPLLLLTFVENSLKYALGVYGGFRLCITAARGPDGTCRICIEDSGKGFPEQVLEALEGGDEVRTQDGRVCIGISNARQRMLYAFGEKASIHFSNHSSLGGAKVLITLPMAEKENAV